MSQEQRNLTCEVTQYQVSFVRDARQESVKQLKKIAITDGFKLIKETWRKNELYLLELQPKWKVCRERNRWKALQKLQKDWYNFIIV